MADQLLYDVDDVRTRLCMGRTVLYEKIKTGELRSVKVGRRRLIPAVALDEYVERLLADSAGSTAA